MNVAVGFTGGGKHHAFDAIFACMLQYIECINEVIHRSVRVFYELIHTGISGQMND